ncbi:hypothetical protein FA13DRAFT_287727 [Coprinellus micaceus]|uniref:DUF6533 domain-containing protein n=1 Tax=Coprinellus micaceus TaxID=71717 RepID=A0A4Y7TE03_COPMI|nr:hypothetical protein FA13DRAFT_287727 [Coprinellus micaceus]
MSGAPPAGALETLIAALKVTSYSNYVALAGFALVIADYLHTFPDEVRYMWPARLSLPKLLFFAMRYYIFVNNIFNALYIFPRDASPELCHSRFFRAAMSCTVLVLGAEGILFLRVYAFSGRSKRLLAYLVVQFCAIHGTAYPILISFLNSMEYRQLPLRNLPCMPVTANATLLGGVFATLLEGVIIALVLMIFLANRKHHLALAVSGFKSPLLSVFYRDGIFYFICLSAILTTNIIITFTAPREYKLHFIQLAVDLYVILSTRMLLHLRQWAERDGLQEYQSGTFAARTMDGVDYSASHRPLTPIQFQDREAAAPMDTRWTSSTGARSTVETDIQMSTL